MDSTLLYILVSVFIVSLISFVGVVTLVLSKRQLNNAMIFLVSFAAGGLFGGAFLDLFPNAVERGGANVIGFGIVGILAFFVMEKFLFWQHCHRPGCHEHSFAYTNLVGDCVHNFIDGVVIGASYMASTPLGIASTVAIVFHEIPHELGHFAVLMYGGFTAKRALLINFLTGLTSIAGALITFFVLPSLQNQLAPLISFAAGGFIYVAGTDLVPELHKEEGTERSLKVFISLILGVALIFILKLLWHE